jgi:hypothetical protein
MAEGKRESSGGGNVVAFAAVDNREPASMVMSQFAARFAPLVVRTRGC